MRSRLQAYTLSGAFFLLAAIPWAHTQTSASLLGTWQVKENLVSIRLILNADGTGKLDDTAIRYSVKDNILSVDEGGHVNRYGFVLAGNNLTLTGGDLDRPMTFEKQGVAPATGLGARRTQPPASPASPLGSWETPGPSGPIALMLRADGTGTFGGGTIRWQYEKGILALTGPNGTVIKYNASLAQESLTLTGADLREPVVFRSVAATAERPGEVKTDGDSSKAGIIGSWQGPQGVIQFNANGSMSIQGVPYRYTLQGNVITLIGNDGSIPMPYKLNGESLTVTLNGQVAVLKRIASDAPASQGGAAKSSAAELVGKWCYFSSFSAVAGGGSMTDECFTINPNGTYTYHREGSISAYAPGMYGGTASQTDDSGSISVSGSTLTVVSRLRGTSSYALEKRNHPKTGDAMLCLDGRCYVTAYQRPAWR
jgi:hypothetical protein